LCEHVSRNVTTHLRTCRGLDPNRCS
jgi:hypothetical protein